MGMLSSQSPESLRLVMSWGCNHLLERVCDDLLCEDTDCAPSSRLTVEPDPVAESVICPLVAEKCLEKLVETLRTR